MDFRVAPSASELAWGPPKGAPGKTKTVPATYQGKRLSVQTPQCNSKLFTNPHGGITLMLSPGGDDISQQFVDFVETYERAAAAKHFAPDMSKCVYNGAIRLMCWEDTQWFDETGAYLPQPPDAAGSVICALEFLGCWVTPQKWGLKWRVAQVKVCSSEDPPQFAFLDD